MWTAHATAHALAVAFHAGAVGPAAGEQPGAEECFDCRRHPRQFRSNRCLVRCFPGRHRGQHRRLRSIASEREIKKKKTTCVCAWLKGAGVARRYGETHSQVPTDLGRVRHDGKRRQLARIVDDIEEERRAVIDHLTRSAPADRLWPTGGMRLEWVVKSAGG